MPGRLERMWRSIPLGTGMYLFAVWVWFLLSNVFASIWFMEAGLDCPAWPTMEIAAGVPAVYAAYVVLLASCFVLFAEIVRWEYFCSPDSVLPIVVHPLVAIALGIASATAFVAGYYALPADPATLLFYLGGTVAAPIAGIAAGIVCCSNRIDRDDVKEIG